MARAKIKLIPNQDQLTVFAYSDHVASTWEYLADTFKGPSVACELSLVYRPQDRGGIGLGLWIDGICVPYEWCHVTHLSPAEKLVLVEYGALKANNDVPLLISQEN